jgi:hypothetical protein
MPSARDQLLHHLVRDLIGPQNGAHEEIKAWPSDQYITGILYPSDLGANPEDDDDHDGVDDDEGSPGGVVPAGMTRRPSVMGISFAVEGASPRIRITARGARYAAQGADDESKPPASWIRRPVDLSPPTPITVKAGLQSIATTLDAVWWVRGLLRDGQWQVTVALQNTAKPGSGRRASEETHLFQVGFEVEAVDGARIIPRNTRRAGAHEALDEDERINEVIYRDRKEFAVGHTCGASWTAHEPVTVRSAWVPEQRVPAMSPDGHRCFVEEATKGAVNGATCYDAEALANAADGAALGRLLQSLPRAYTRWLDDVEAKIADEEKRSALSASMAAQARENVRNARDVLGRIQGGVDMLAAPENEKIRRAFQLAQRAMLIQRRWGVESKTAAMSWRPFQLAFQLLTLRGIAAADEASKQEREVMDLLWFPTGGGKTEAYLAITAFTLFWRRLRQDAPDRGAGVAVLMRYTLRLLTVQQFERASRLVLACESLRRDAQRAHDASLGAVPFSIGLWVGNSATPGKVKHAREDKDEAKRAQQLARCPACSGEHLKWDVERNTAHYVACCPDQGCPLGGTPFPVYTIDEDVYAKQPSLVIGTIDKFAQIVRNPNTFKLFHAVGGPPELIIQDELHLISGPLGTIAGLYEAAIDLICSQGGLRPKILGSTATIRRAREQVRSLFDREVLQFPPPVLDATDSGFAVVDESAPGRLYAGITTAGRSPKFILQAACASLLQSAGEDAVVPPAERDPYWTMIGYFNSLRELGGALIMMQDDVHDSMKTYAELHGTRVRKIDEPIELTSRVPQEQIPKRLVELEREYKPGKPSSQDIAIVLATNMIAVGVDIPRFGLMVVNGQPKTMSEYIQATSRVGRNRVPGLVLTSYNSARPRDRSHYEAFRSWHMTLYREVEATSVTPFAPRARDRALHAAIVALARHCVDGMLEDTTFNEARRDRVQHFVDQLVDRVKRIDPAESVAVGQELEQFVDEWDDRAPLNSYWDERDVAQSLLVSAEVVAEARAVSGQWTRPARATLNSMRDVEAGVQFRLVTALKDPAVES